jgi:hypothetical protein
MICKLNSFCQFWTFFFIDCRSIIVNPVFYLGSCLRRSSCLLEAENLDKTLHQIHMKPHFWCYPIYLAWNAYRWTEKVVEAQLIHLEYWIWGKTNDSETIFLVLIFRDLSRGSLIRSVESNDWSGWWFSKIDNESIGFCCSLLMFLLIVHLLGCRSM